MSTNRSVRTACYGNLALAPSYTPYRVIDGGQRHRQAQRSIDTVRTHEVQPRSRQAARMSRDALVRSARATLLTIATMALVIAVLSLTWRVSDVMSDYRVQHALQDVSYQTIVVHTGDTLWSIAEAHAVHGCTTEELVAHIRDINNIQDSCLGVGTRLEVPRT